MGFLLTVIAPLSKQNILASTGSLNTVAIRKTGAFGFVYVCVNHRVDREEVVEGGAPILPDWLSRLFGGVSGIEQEVQAKMTSLLQEHME